MNIFCRRNAQCVNTDPRPAPRSVTDLVALPAVGRHGALFVFGGEFTPSSQGHDGAGEFHRDAWLFDLDSEQWTKVCANKYVYLLLTVIYMNFSIQYLFNVILPYFSVF